MNDTTRIAQLPAHERGAALFTALIILVAITVAALASLGTSLMELRMSANEEARMSAVQSAQAAIDNVVSAHDAAVDAKQDAQMIFKITGTVGYTSCTANWATQTSTSCNTSTIALTAPLDSSATGPNWLRSERKSDAVNTVGGKCTTTALFEVTSVYDLSTLGRGRAEIVQGYDACIYTDPPPPLPVEAQHN